MKTANEILKQYKDEDLPEFAELELNDVNQRGNFSNTPLHVACVRGNLDEVCGLLLAGADVDAIGELGNTPLHDAASQGHVEVIQKLLESGASSSITNEGGDTPRDCAVQRKLAPVVELLNNWSMKH